MKAKESQMPASAYTELLPQHHSALAPTPVRLLTVGIEDADHSELASFLCEPECTLYRAHTRSDAFPLIRRYRPSVVICEQFLPDGTWRDLLDDLQDAPRSPMLIVCSLLADDRLWAEVLNIGGFDVLMKPFHGTEVTRVVQMAARQVR
jgi:DNA-binding response OmpR family regulator